MKFKYLEQVYLKDNYLTFFNPTQIWVIKGYILDKTGAYSYCLYPHGVQKELAPVEEVWMYESNLETSTERNIRKRKQEVESVIRSQEEFYLDVLRKQELQAKIMSMKDISTWPDVQPGYIKTTKDIIERVKKEPEIMPEYSYEPIFKEDKE